MNKSSIRVNGKNINLHGIAGVVDTATIKKVCRTLGRLAKQNPCGGLWVTTLDKCVGRVVGIEPVAALATRIWDALGGSRDFSRSTRMDGTQTGFDEAWAR